MLKKISLIVLTILLVNSLFAQNTFLKTYGMPGEDRLDRGYAVLEADDGGYVAVGETGLYWNIIPPYEYFGNIFLIKTDIYGDTLWTKTYGNNEHDQAFSLDKTDDGGYIISGYDGYHTRGDDYGLWIIKTDGLGDSIWSKKFELGKGKSICTTSDGGYVVTGTNFGDSVYNVDVYLLKIDSLGNKQWLKNYDKTKRDNGLCVQQTKDGGFIISAITPYKTRDDIWLIKTDSVGDTIWSKIYTSKYSTYGYSVCQTTDGGYFIAGSKSEKIGMGELENKIYLLKTDSVGDTIWTKIIRKSYSDIVYSGIQTTDGGYIAVGETITGNFRNIYIVKLDYEGNILWTNEIGNLSKYEFRGRDIAETKDMGYIITGLKADENFDYVDLCLLKVDSKGILTSLKNGLNDKLPQDFRLFQNYPNPFNPTTEIKYEIGEARFVSLKVYNVLGQEIATLINKEQSAGSYNVVFNGNNLPSGIYLIKMTAGKYTNTIKALLIK